MDFCQQGIEIYLHFWVAALLSQVVTCFRTASSFQHTKALCGSHTTSDVTPLITTILENFKIEMDPLVYESKAADKRQTLKVHMNYYESTLLWIVTLLFRVLVGELEPESGRLMEFSA